MQPALPVTGAYAQVRPASEQVSLVGPSGEQWLATDPLQEPNASPAQRGVVEHR